MRIRALTESDLPAVKAFTDLTIGKNYFSKQELQKSFEQSIANNSTRQKIMCSFVLLNEKNQMKGFRLAYPPGAWSKGKGAQLRPDLWKVPLQSAAYFQSLFLAPEVQGKGWGPKLSEAALEVFRSLGAKAVVTHAWKESPNNSSVRYLKKFGFEIVATHPKYWVDVDYHCVLDGKPCQCTAEEMIKYL